MALSGRVVEHRYGYRAERAVIRRLRLGPFQLLGRSTSSVSSRPVGTALGVGTYLKVEGQDDLLGVQDELERRYQAPVKLGGMERRIARRLWDELPLFASGMGIGVVRPEAGWRLG